MIEESRKILNVARRALKFLLPFVFWLFLFYPIVTGRVIMVGDTSSFYVIIKFFIDNLSMGIFALWSPFLFFGFPLLSSFLAFGPFNPMWLLIGILRQVGISSYLAFLWTYLGYFFVGVLGFYLLVKALLKDATIAYIAFLMLLFSSQGMHIFSSPNSLFVSVPAIWFFYFLVRFWQTWEKRFFVGLVFTFMIIANCYLPFYWLTVFIIVSILYFVFYARQVPKDFSSMLLFVRKHHCLVVFCSLAAGLLLVTSFQGYSIIKRGDVVVRERKVLDQEAYGGGADVSYEKAAGLCGTAQMMTKRLFLDLDKISACYSTPYFSLFVYCILLLGLFYRIKKKAFLVFLLALVLFLISLGSQTSVYKFFYQHFSYFKLIHGLGTFYFVIGPVFILFVALQLKSLLEDKLSIPHYLRLGSIFLIHAGIWFFLQSQPMLLSTQITIVLSALFFSLFVLKRRFPRLLWFALLILCVVTQPAEVMWRFHDDLENMDFNKDRVLQNYVYLSGRPSFSFERPPFLEKYDAYDSHASFVQMKDAAGFPLVGAGCPSRWSYDLMRNFGSLARQYVKYKFYLYDHVNIAAKEKESLVVMEEILGKNKDLALVHLPLRSQQSLLRSSLITKNQDIAGRALSIAGPSDLFEVLDFDVNSIKIRTRFDKEKFLIYTDSFQPDWKAKLNGKRVPIYRANIAFKGVVLSPGENVLVFYYAPLGGALFYFFVLALHLGMLFYLIILFLRQPLRLEERF